jgi:hypothetical protein
MVILPSREPSHDAGLVADTNKTVTPGRARSVLTCRRPRVLLFRHGRGRMELFWRGA